MAARARHSPVGFGRPVRGGWSRLLASAASFVGRRTSREAAARRSRCGEGSARARKYPSVQSLAVAELHRGANSHASSVAVRPQHRPPCLPTSPIVALNDTHHPKRVERLPEAAIPRAFVIQWMQPSSRSRSEIVAPQGGESPITPTPARRLCPHHLTFCGSRPDSPSVILFSDTCSGEHGKRYNTRTHTSGRSYLCTSVR